MENPLSQTRLLIFDSNSIFMRAYHALLKQGLSYNGKPTWGIYGTIQTISYLIRWYKPTHIIAAFDWGKSEYRLAIWPQYKAGRPDKASDPYYEEGDSESQLEQVQNLLPKAGIPIWREEGVEADDIIGCIVDVLEDEVDRIMIISGDKDLRQLISKKTTVHHPGLGDKAPIDWDHDKVVEHYGVPPERLPEIWALSGDKVDYIPGVPGIGEKTAINLINKYGNLSMVALSDEKKIIGYHHDIKMSFKLVTINPELSNFNLSLKDLKFKPPTTNSENGKEFLSLIDGLGFDSLSSQFSTGTLWNERGIRLRDMKKSGSS